MLPFRPQVFFSFLRGVARGGRGEASELRERQKPSSIAENTALSRQVLAVSHMRQRCLVEIYSRRAPSGTHMSTVSHRVALFLRFHPEMRLPSALFLI